MGNERDASLDILKGFAILCVVLGHINGLWQCIC